MEPVRELLYVVLAAEGNIDLRIPVIRSNRAPIAVLCGLGLACFVVALNLHHFAVTMGLLAAGVACVVGGVLVNVGQLRGSVARRVTADRAGIRVDGDPTVARDDIRAVVLDRSQELTVRVEGAERRPLLVLRAGFAEAAGIAEGLGVPPPTERYAGSALPGAYGALAFALLYVVIIALGVAGRALFHLPLNAFTAAFTIAFMAISRGFQIAIDDRGVTEIRPGARRRHPWADILRIEPTARSMAVHRRDGSVLALTVGAFVRGAERRLLIEAAVARARSGLGRHEAAAVGASVRALLDPARSDPSTWIARLRELAHEGYRAVRPADDELWRVVEDGAEIEARRGAAALVLGRRLDEAGRARMRVAASDDGGATKLRVALEAAAEGDLEAVEDALAHLVPRRAAR